MHKDPTKEALKAVHALRLEGQSDDTLARLKKVLRQANGIVVAEAALLASEWFATELTDELADAFVRLRDKGLGEDPQCWGKVALIKALHELAHQDGLVYLKGCQTFQLEPVYGGKEDSAVAVRSLAFGALVQLPVIDFEKLMIALADLLADPSPRVRAEAARLSVSGPADKVAPLLRLKLKLGDTETRVMGACCDALLTLAPGEENLELIESLAQSDNGALEAEALAALAGSSHAEAVTLAITAFDRLFDPQLRRIVIMAMAASATGEADAFLLSLLAEDEPEALWALEALKPKRHNPELDKEIEAILAQHHPHWQT
ncbi:MAG: hypothetical protein KC422_16325 [Trueperaceae bacterium]|nr:hypothetical protein [Trueperaceae bacterium]